MYTHKTQIRVRYEETDQMGYVYHGKYMSFFEVGRVEWLRSIGVSYKEMEQKKVMLPVANMTIEYRKPATYDEVITIKTSLRELPSRKIIFDYSIFDEAMDIIVTASSTLFFVNTDTKRTTRCPEYLFERIKAIL